MRIHYIAPIAAVTTNEVGWVEEQVVNALHTVFINPIQSWLYGTWVKFIDISFIFCLSVAFIGAVCGILGIKKGYKATLLAIVFFFLIRLFSWGMGWY